MSIGKTLNGLLNGNNTFLSPNEVISKFNELNNKIDAVPKLPSVNELNNGQVLLVENGEWNNGDIPSNIPNPLTGTQNDIIYVDENNEYVLGKIPPIISSVQLDNVYNSAGYVTIELTDLEKVCDLGECGLYLKRGEITLPSGLNATRLIGYKLDVSPPVNHQSFSGSYGSCILGCGIKCTSGKAYFYVIILAIPEPATGENPDSIFINNYTLYGEFISNSTVRV